jgi:hypothetical protein
MKLNTLMILMILLTGACYGQSDIQTKDRQPKIWKMQLDQQLPLLGHRNWILVVDKAFPAQNASGIITINTGEAFFPVLQYTLAQINSSTHIKPIIFTDKELNYITDKQVPEIEKFKTKLFAVIPKDQVQTMLHDSVFVKIAKASDLFRIIILKTEQIIPYSSVFLQLDCKYWGAEDEKQLRESMRHN